VRTLKLTVAYDGSHFHGWQHQPGQATIQGALTAAWLELTGEQAELTGCGRTDAGVHALGQVVSVDTQSLLPAADLERALNALLPAEIIVHSAEEARPGFHAIRDCLGKRYRYTLYDGDKREIFRRATCWQLHHRLDAAAMQRAARSLVGRHDFASFQSTGSPRESTVRTITDLTVRRGEGDDADFVEVEVAADGFLYNMVRAIVGTLVEVGRGRRPEAWPAQVLAQRDRRAAGMTAPALGLCLLRAEYPPFVE
jgi:tRNA pseudouridine38-40 synthase